MAKEYKILTNLTMREVNEDQDCMFDEVGTALWEEQQEKLSELGYDMSDECVLHFRSRSDDYLEIDTIENAIQRLDLKNGCDLVRWKNNDEQMKKSEHIGFIGYGNQPNPKNGFEIIRKKDFLDELAYDWIGTDLREEGQAAREYAIKLIKEEIDNHGSEAEYTEHFDKIYDLYFRKAFPDKEEFIRYFMDEMGHPHCYGVKTWKDVVEFFDDEDYCYDVFDGKKYRISGGDYFGLELENKEDCGPDDCSRSSNTTNDPREALRMWFQMGKRYPTCVSIEAKTRDIACELLRAATPEYITELYEQYGNWMKLEYIIREAEENLNKGCSSLIEGEYGDCIHPFCCG